MGRPSPSRPTGGGPQPPRPPPGRGGPVGGGGGGGFVPPKFESAPRTTQTPLPVQGGRGIPPMMNRGGPPPLPARDDEGY